MLLEQLMKDLKAALEQRVEWDVYYAYDPTPFAERPGWFLTLGIASLEMQDPFLSNDYLYYPFSAKPQVTLLAPPETNASVLYDGFHRGIVSGMLSSGCTIRRIQTPMPEEIRQLQRISLRGDFVIDGVFQIRKREEVGME